MGAGLRAGAGIDAVVGGDEFFGAAGRDWVAALAEPDALSLSLSSLLALLAWLALAAAAKASFLSPRGEAVRSGQYEYESC